MRVLIVDAHSVIFSWPELRKLHARRMILAREALLRIINEYCDYTGIHGVAVFDGQGERTSEETVPGGVQIFYAAADKTADQVIERLVARYADEHTVMVVTSDMLEQQTVISFGGEAISAERFKELAESSHAALLDDIRKRSREPWR